jgi:hypothetical protein
MRVVIFLVSSLTVCGFYVYVLAQLYREEKRQESLRNRLQEHLHEVQPETRNAAPKTVTKTINSGIGFSKRGVGRDNRRPRFDSLGAVALKSKAEAKARRDTVISLVLGVGGLAALFAGLEFFNSLLTMAH